MKDAGNRPAKCRRALRYGGMAALLALVTTVVLWLIEGRASWQVTIRGLLAALVVWELLAFCLYRVRHAPRLVSRLTWGTLGAIVLLETPAGIPYILDGDLPLWLLTLTAAGLLLCLTVCGLARYFLAPLEELYTALEDVCARGAGAQMDLNGTARTELYKIGRMFNLFSLCSRTRQNALQAAGDTYRQLVPVGLLDVLGKRDVTELVPGQTEPLQEGLLVLMPDAVPLDGAWLDRMVDTVERCHGAIVGYDLSRQALIAAFEGQPRAADCARTCTDGHNAVAAILRQQAGFGFFGGERGLYPVVQIPGVGRRLAVLALLRGFGARLLYSGGDGDGLRLLGWDDGELFYEDTALRPAEWQAGWRKAAPLWAEALTLYRARAFAAAMRRLTEVLHILPHEEAARWYLFRCHALRECPAAQRDLDLLYEGERIP